MNIAIFDVDEWERRAFDALHDEHTVTLSDQPLDEDNADEYTDAEAISTFIYSDLGADVLDRLGKLRLIATRSTGFDHIDLDYCNQRGIMVANVPTYGANTVAEHVFGLLLTISHRLEEAIDRTRKGDFSPRGLRGFDLQGRTLGIVGTGDIGRHAARIGRGFGMEVIAFDIKPDDEAARELGFQYVSLEQLLEQSDVISLHVPGNAKTRHLIDREQFARMKDGAVLINTARGSIVNVQAMVRALAEGKLAAAGLDVLAEEPVVREEAELLRSVYERTHDLQTLLADHVLLRLRNVVVTPHSAFNTNEAVRRILDTTRENLVGFARGESCNIVNEDAAAHAD